MARIIAGIGSRKTPPEILLQMEELGALCRELGVWVRSGHAPGADYAFEKGALDKALVYLPFPNFNSQNKLLTKQVVSLPPAEGKNWRKGPDTSAVMRAYHTIITLFKEKFIDGMDRQHYYASYFAVFGSSGADIPVDAVVCWAPVDGYGMAKGGTGQAVRIANAAGIPVFNLFKTDVGEVEEFLR